MKSTSSLWTAPNTGATNESGFTGLPGGSRNSDGTFGNVGDYGLLWSSTEFDTNDAWYRTLNYSSGVIFRNYYNKTHGFSVRLIKEN
jgi:uncharacterized protein (TIGR02145 family)